jgi:hypothetical protein
MSILCMMGRGRGRLCEKGHFLSLCSFYNGVLAFVFEIPCALTLSGGKVEGGAFSPAYSNAT